MEEKLLSSREVAARLGLALGTVQRYLKEGQIKGAKFGGRKWKIRPSEVEKFIERIEKKQVKK